MNNSKHKQEMRYRQLEEEEVDGDGLGGGLAVRQLILDDIWR